MISLYGAECQSLENASKPKDIPIKKYCNLELHPRCVKQSALNNGVEGGPLKEDILNLSCPLVTCNDVASGSSTTCKTNKNSQKLSIE